MSEKLKKETFEPHVGKTFQLKVTEGQVIEVALHSVRAMGEREPRDEPWLQTLRTHPFALLFVLPTEAQLPQATYQLSHEATGEIGIFLVPVGMDQNGRYYEAVFN